MSIVMCPIIKRCAHLCNNCNFFFFFFINNFYVLHFNFVKVENYQGMIYLGLIFNFTSIKKEFKKDVEPQFWNEVCPWMSLRGNSATLKGYFPTTCGYHSEKQNTNEFAEGFWVTSEGDLNTNELIKVSKRKIRSLGTRAPIWFIEWKWELEMNSILLGTNMQKLMSSSM